MKIKIISWNVAGIRAGIRKGLWQKMRDIGADVYCFQEAKARPEQIEMGLDYQLVNYGSADSPYRQIYLSHHFEPTSF